MATKKAPSKSKAAPRRGDVFPAGNKGITQAVATAKRRGEPSITFQLKKTK